MDWYCVEVYCGFPFGFGAYEGGCCTLHWILEHVILRVRFHMSLTRLLLRCRSRCFLSLLPSPPVLLLGYTRVHAQQLENFNILFYPVIPGVMVSPFYLKALRLGVYSLVRLDVELEIERTGFGRECDLPA